MQKMKIDDRLYDVMQPQDFMSQLNNITPGKIAVQVGDVVLPYTSTYGNTPGYYATQIAGIPYYPEQEHSDKYSADNIVNFDNCENIKELMKTNAMLKSLEKDILTSSDNIYVPPIHSDDTSEMIGLKEAITLKEIDIDKYQERFGSLYNNDKRMLNNSPSITFPKLKSVMTNLDMIGTLIIEDAPDAPNPIGQKIIIPLNYIMDEEEGE